MHHDRHREGREDSQRDSRNSNEHYNRSNESYGGRWNDQNYEGSGYENRNRPGGRSNRTDLNQRQSFENQDYDRYDRDSSNAYEDRYDRHYQNRDFNSQFNHHENDRGPRDQDLGNDSYRERRSQYDSDSPSNYGRGYSHGNSDYDNYGSGSYRSRNQPDRDERYGSSYRESRRENARDLGNGGNARNDYGSYNSQGRSVPSNEGSPAWGEYGRGPNSGDYEYYSNSGSRYSSQRNPGYSNSNRDADSYGNSEREVYNSDSYSNRNPTYDSQDQRSSLENQERRGAQPGHRFYGNQYTSGRGHGARRRGGFGSRSGSGQGRESNERDTDY